MATRIKLTIFSLDKDGYHIRIKVMINGKPADFILDTGASRTVFDKNAVEEFLPQSDLTEHDATTSGVGSNALQSYSTIIREFEIGKLKWAISRELIKPFKFHISILPRRSRLTQ